MRKYTSKTDKINFSIQKYNITKEKAIKIFKEDEALLTLEELKIRYDNPNIGKLPNWLKNEQLDQMIWKTIQTHWSIVFENNLTKEDMYMHLQIYIRQKINLYDNFAHIKTALCNEMKTYANMICRRGKYFSFSLDTDFNNENQKSCNEYTFIASEDNIEKDSETSDLINRILKIKNRKVKELLIITGYLVCEIDALRSEYLEILRHSNKTTIKQLEKLERRIERNDKIERNKLEGKKSNVKSKALNIKEIIEITKFYRPYYDNSIYLEDKEQKKLYIQNCINKSLKELRFYLENFKVFDI